MYVSRLHTTGPNPSNLVGTSTHAHTFYGGSFGARTASSEGSGRRYRAGMGRRRIALVLNLRIRRAAGEFHRGECRDGRETRARTLTRSLDVRFGGVRAADQDKYRNPRRENQRGKIQSRNTLPVIEQTKPRKIRARQVGETKERMEEADGELGRPANQSKEVDPYIMGGLS